MDSVIPDHHVHGRGVVDPDGGSAVSVLGPANGRFCCSLVIPTKNGGPLFARVMDRLRSQSCWSDVEAIIVDSGSTDGTLEIARQAGARVYEIEASAFNHGATRDYGISLTSSEIVVLMVQDAVPLDDRLIERLLAPFQDEAVAGVYARQLPQPDADVLTKRNLNSWLTGRPKSEVRQIRDPGHYEALSPIDKYFFCNFDNVCAAIKKSAWKREKFGPINFGEDIDWAERVLKRGHGIAYEADAIVIHSHSRPVSYEYKRTYVCHRKLFRQFGLHLVPTLHGIVASWFRSTVNDLRYVCAHEPSLINRLGMMCRVPLLNLLSAYAQYRAVQDELSGIQRSVRGV